MRGRFPHGEPGQEDAQKRACVLHDGIEHGEALAAEIAVAAELEACQAHRHARRVERDEKHALFVQAGSQGNGVLFMESDNVGRGKGGRLPFWMAVGGLLEKGKGQELGVSLLKGGDPLAGGFGIRFGRHEKGAPGRPGGIGMAYQGSQAVEGQHCRQMGKCLAQKRFGAGLRGGHAHKICQEAKVLVLLVDNVAAEHDFLAHCHYVAIDAPVFLNPQQGVANADLLKRLVENGRKTVGCGFLKLIGGERVFHNQAAGKGIRRRIRFPGAGLPPGLKGQPGNGRLLSAAAAQRKKIFYCAFFYYIFSGVFLERGKGMRVKSDGPERFFSWHGGMLLMSEMSDATVPARNMPCIFFRPGGEMGKGQARIWGTLHPFFESGEIMGRSVANNGFIHALLAANPFDGYHFFLPQASMCSQVEERLRAAFPDLWKAGAFEAHPVFRLPEKLAGLPYWCFHLSDCTRQFAFLCRLRNAVAQDIFPVTAVTHTLSYARYSLEFLVHLWPGATAREAVVATSKAGRAVMEAYYRFLRASYGLGASFLSPRICRIPLGVDIRPLSAAERLAERARLAADDGDTVFLAFGRFSHASKMDLLPLLNAFRLAADKAFHVPDSPFVRRLKRRLEEEGEGCSAVFRPLDPERIRLVLAGWNEAGDEVPRLILSFAKNLGIPAILVTRPEEGRRRELYAGADVFVSPSDNVQETFGLTLLEAGAAGLPAIASDWDGYRDIVRQCDTGLLVPTLGPAATDGTDALAQTLYDNHVHLWLAQETAFDLPDFAAALRALAHAGKLRKTMGMAARRRVERKFSWSRVVERYVRLWEELWKQPADREALRARVHPLEFSYADIFGGHPGERLQDTMLLRTSALGEALYRGREQPVFYAGLGERVRLEDVRRILVRARRPATVGRLRGLFSETVGMEERDFPILWLLKQGYLERVFEAGGQA